jgi:hypothetical protein
MKMRISAVTIGVAVWAAWSISGISAEPQPNEVKNFMRVKLSQSQKVLEG